MEGRRRRTKARDFIDSCSVFSIIDSMILKITAICLAEKLMIRYNLWLAPLLIRYISLLSPGDQVHHLTCIWWSVTSSHLPWWSGTFSDLPLWISNVLWLAPLIRVCVCVTELKLERHRHTPKQFQNKYGPRHTIPRRKNWVEIPYFRHTEISWACIME